MNNVQKEYNKKVKALKPAPSIEEVTDMLIESMHDHDVGWAYVTQGAVFKVNRNTTKEAIVEFVIPQYNTIQKKYIITIKEA
jgi:hypothetical protein